MLFNKNKKNDINRLIRECKYTEAILLIDDVISSIDVLLRPAYYDSFIYLKKLCLMKENSKLLNVKNNENNNVILLINPSHSHDHECTFWSDFIQSAREVGFEVIDLNYRNVKPFAHNLTLVNPARCKDLANKYRNFKDEPIPSWCSEDLIYTYEDWEHRRWEIDKYDPNVRLGVKFVASYIDTIIDAINPCAVITSNKIDWPNQCGYLAAKHKNIPYFFFERSPLDSHLIESEGMFSESDRNLRLFKSIDCNLKPLVESELLINSLVDNPYGFRASEAIKQEFDGHIVGKKMFFLPLDNILWTAWGVENHKQGEIDYPFFNDPLDAIKKINEEVEILGGYLVVKPHPSCKEFKLISEKLPEICFSNADLSLLLDLSDVVVTFLTKVSYVALAKSKPVVSFGAGLLDGLGVTYEVVHPSSLNGKLREALEKVNIDGRINRFKFLLPHLNASFFNSGKEGFDFIYDKIGNGKLIDVNCLNECLKIKPIKIKSNLNETYVSDKTSLIFDVTRLTNGALKFSGVTRYAWNLLEELMSNGCYDIYLGAFPQKNKFGISARVIQNIERKFGKPVLSMDKLIDDLERCRKKYIIHSPINPEVLNIETEYASKVITVHDILHLTENHYKSGSYQTEKIVDAIIEHQPAVIFVSDYSRKEFENYTRKSLDKKKITHLGISDYYGPTYVSSKFLVDLGLNPDSRKIIFPYQGDPRKGFSRMLSICNEIAGSSKDIVFISYGSSSNKSKYIKYLNENVSKKYHDLFKYFESPSDEVLAKLYTKSSLFMYLSESEGFGLPPLEAMKCGCPALMLNNTSLQEVYDGWALKFENIDAKVILSLLERASEDDKYLESLRNSAILFSSKFSWKLTAAKTLDFYREIVSSETT